MSIPNPKIEVGFDLTDSSIGPFLRLDDAVAGKLDDPDWVLGGTIFVDVTDRVRRFSIQRGRNTDFTSFTSGQVSVEFNNHDRAFDPLYTASPFYGNIVPRREIKVYSNDVIQFSGWISDWNLEYTPDGNSTVTATANDALSIIAGQTVAAFTPDEELSGERIGRILSDPDVNWATELTDLDAGQSLLGAYPVEDDTNALQYIQLVTQSEPGSFFVAKDGKLTFRDRTSSPSSESLITFGGSGLPFQNIGVVYGSENLYNEIVIARVGGGTAVATDSDSIGQYGIRNLTQTDLLMATDAQSVELALVYANRYSEPEYRFETLEVALHDLDEEEKEDALTLELGSIVRIIFTPNNIGDPIDRYLEVIRIDHNVDPQTHFMTLGFQALDYASLVLDDAEFGKLDTYALSW